MIGEIRKIITPYYDNKLGKKSFKSRPGLIISETNGYDQDRIVLPVSTIKDPKYRDPVYDLSISKCDFPALKLNDDSFIRTGKPTLISGADIGSIISDFKSEYPDKYLEVMVLYEKYSKYILEKVI